MFIIHVCKKSNYTCVSSVVPSPLAPKSETLTVIGVRKEALTKLFKPMMSSLRLSKLSDLNLLYE